MEKKLPEFKPLPELGNVSSNYMSAFNVGMNIYEALSYLQGYVQITYNSVDDLINDWNNFEAYVTENINQIANEKTQEILNQWLEDGTLSEILVTNPQPNLLINADFKSGIINQRGQTTYATGNKVTVDMWRKSSGIVTVGTNSITYTNTSAIDVGLDQVVDFKGPITIYVNATVATGSATLALYSSLEYDTDDLEEYNLTSGENIFHVESGTIKILQIKLRQNSSIVINQVKVEKGSIFTGMPYWNYTEELVKCLRYQKVFYLNTMFNASGTDEYQETYPFEIELYKTPSVDVLDQGSKTNVLNIDYFPGNNRLVLSITASGQGHTFITNNKIVLDANQY